MVLTGLGRAAKSAVGRDIDFNEVACAGQALEVDVRDAPYLHIVEGQPTFDVNRSGSGFKIRFAEITGAAVESDSQLGPTPGVGEFNVNVVAVDSLFEELNRLFRSQSG